MLRVYSEDTHNAAMPDTINLTPNCANKQTGAIKMRFSKDLT